MSTDIKAGRPAGEGAILAGSDKYKEFANIWNNAEETSEIITVQKKDKKLEVGGRMGGILKALRAAKIANDKTDPSQVRAFASKVRDAGHELKVFTERLNRSIVVRAWMLSKTPSEAFKKSIEAGLFKGVKTVEELSGDDLKNKRASFNACVQQLKKVVPAMKNMGAAKGGRSRAAAIDDAKFIEAWTSSTSIAEVKDKLVEAGIIGAEFKISSLKSKAKTLREKGHDLKKLNSGEEINDLNKLAKMLMENPDAEFEIDSDEDEEEEEDEDDDDDDDDSDDSDVSLDDFEE